MERLAGFRISADHYQYFVYDSEAEPCPEFFYEEPDGARETGVGSYEQGYVSDGLSICVCTSAHLNTHWIEVFRSDAQPDIGKSERIIVLPLEISSGRACFTQLVSFEPDCTVHLSPGRYDVYVMAFSLDRDRLNDPTKPSDWLEHPLTDEELAARTDYEHYQVVFVKSDVEAPAYGVIHGAPTMAEAQRAAGQREG